MKQNFLIVFFFFLLFVIFGTAAQASRARTRALGQPFHLLDHHYQYITSFQVFMLPDAVVLESGNTTPTNPENNSMISINKSIDEKQKLAFAIGRLDESVQANRRFMNLVGATNFIPQQNSFNVIYGLKGSSIDVAVGTYYSQFKNKINDDNETSGGIKLGVSHGPFKWRLNIGLVNKVENSVDGKFDGSPYYNLGLRLLYPAHKFGLDVIRWDARQNNTTDTEVQSHSFLNAKLSYVRDESNDVGLFFYGVAIDSTELKNKLSNLKLTRLALPVWVGLEKKVSDEIIFRASLKQTALVAQSKDENGYPAGAADGAFGVAGSEYSAEPDNTEAAMGVGLKFDKLLIDGVIKSLVGRTQNQQIDLDDLFTQVAATYQF